MHIKQEDRRRVLKITNQLRNIVNYIDDCRDVEVSQLKRMDEMVFALYSIFNFKPPKDKDGNTKPWADWVFGEDVK